MSFERRSYVGGAPATALQAGISSADLAFDGLSGTGYADGGSGPFSVVIGRGLANEEKILVAARSTTTFTVASGGRGYDGTSASFHAVGETIEVCGTAIDFDEANAHVTDPTRDDHTNYLTTGRHDLAVRHAFGAALPTPAAAQSVGTTNTAGTAGGPARADHVHKLGSGAINAGAMFAAGVVPTAAIADNAITQTQVGDAAIGTAELVDSNVTAPKLAANAVTQTAVADNAIGTAELIDANVTAAKLATDAVTTIKIVDANVTRAKLATDARKSVDVAWGYIGSSVSTAQQVGTTSETNLLGLNVTFAAVANRRYKYTAWMPRLQQNSATGEAQMKITDTGNTLIEDGSFAAALLTANAVWTPYAVAYESNITPGTTTRKARISTSAGNIDVNGATHPGRFVVEDIGPS